MCVNDWRLGMLIQSKLTLVSLGVAGRDFPAEPNRVGYDIQVFFPSSTAVGALLIEGTNVQSFLALTSFRPFHCDVTRNGNLPTKAFRVANSLSTINFGVIEYTLPTSVIQAGIAEFQRAYPGSP